MRTPNKTIGIVGGGQLGRMLAIAARELGIKTIVLDPTPGCPAAEVADEHVLGDFTDADAIRALADTVDVLTFEIESAHAETLEALASEGFPVHPTPATLSTIKDKLHQKTYLSERGIPVAPFMRVDSEADARVAGEQFGYPFLLKARRGGYDGRGNATVDSSEDLASAFTAFGAQELYAEAFIPFAKELAVVAARTQAGEIALYPLVETVHRDHICHTVYAPAPVPGVVQEGAEEIVRRVLDSFEGAGVFGIELFLTNDREVMVNEIAPRVHNSGHFTIEACHTSQFSQHIRAVAGLPLGDPSMRVPAAVMINILGSREGVAEPRGVDEALALPSVGVHIYGKRQTKPQRKMGHLTAAGDTLTEATAKALQAREHISI